MIAATTGLLFQERLQKFVATESKLVNFSHYILASSYSALQYRDTSFI